MLKTEIGAHCGEGDRLGVHFCVSLLLSLLLRGRERQTLQIRDSNRSLDFLIPSGVSWPALFTLLSLRVFICTDHAHLLGYFKASVRLQLKKARRTLAEPCSESSFHFYSSLGDTRTGVEPIFQERILMHSNISGSKGQVAKDSDN